MQLVLVKDQAKGLLGGVKFEVRATVRLTEEERELIRHYRLEKEILCQQPLVVFGRSTDQTVPISVKDLVDGTRLECKNVAEVLAYADVLKEACVTLKSYLELARNFGGEEVIDIG